MRSAPSRPCPTPAASKVAEVTQQAATLRSQLRPFEGGNWGTTVPYPTSQDAFPSRLAGLAAMIAAGLPLSCVTVSAPGMYDTHADQPDGLTNALDLTARSLRSFQRDLESRGIADRVLVLVWSEFGRRAEQNGSNGTDHGAAGVGLLMGSRVRGQMLGEFPGWPRAGSTSTATCAPPSTIGRSTARSSSSGSPRTRQRSSPTRRASLAPRS